MDATSQASYDTVMAFMGAMGSGDMDTMGSLMADDMVWHNEGDTSGKDNIFTFLGVFGSNLETTLWENEKYVCSGDLAAAGRPQPRPASRPASSPSHCVPKSGTARSCCGTGSKTPSQSARPTTAEPEPVLLGPVPPGDDPTSEGIARTNESGLVREHDAL